MEIWKWNIRFISLRSTVYIQIKHKKRTQEKLYKLLKLRVLNNKIEVMAVEVEMKSMNKYLWLMIALKLSMTLRKAKQRNLTL